MNHVRQDHLKIEIEKLKCDLKDRLKAEEYHNVRRIHEQTYEKEITSVKRRHLKKFDKLFNKTHDCNELNSKPSVDKSRWVLNLSGKVLSEHENSLLSKGMNFSITPKSVPMK